MCLLQLYLVTIETFVVQRSGTSPPRMSYTTLENTLDQYEMEAMCTMCTYSGSKILMNGEIDMTTSNLKLSIDRFHCHAIKTAPKKYWKPPSGRSQENKML